MSSIETTFNTALAEVLSEKHPAWRDAVITEETGTERGARGRHYDLVVMPVGLDPVVIETEFGEARTVEDDARCRLGKVLDKTGDTVLQVVAMRVPDDFRAISGAKNMRAAIWGGAKFEYALLSHDVDGTMARFPQAGWIAGDADRLVGLIERASTSVRKIAASLKLLQDAVRSQATILMDGLGADPAGIREKIARELKQTNNEQTMRMAMAILANALTFHAVLSEKLGIKNLRELRPLTPSKVLDEWETIMRINYYPVYGVASEILKLLPATLAAKMLKGLASAVGDLIALSLIRSHDLYGRMFQRLITDRKLLATFYTLPESATLLAELGCALLNPNVKDKHAITDLRVADFACGTGTLLSAAYQGILSRYQRAGHDSEKIHKAMMENALIATDIMPAGVHLCVSLLSAMYPQVAIKQTKVIAMNYGRDDETGNIYIGALDLLDREFTRDLLYRQRQINGDGNGDARVGNGQPVVPAEHESFDWVIMNPPFTKQGANGNTDKMVTSFSALGVSAGDRKDMRDRLAGAQKLCNDGAWHGKAGLATNFIDLAHKKLKMGGIFSIIIPAAFAAGEAWKKSRNLLNKWYDDLAVLSLVSVGKNTNAWSADSANAEVMVLGRKRKSARKNGESASVKFATVNYRPGTHYEASVMAEAIRATNTTDTIKIGKDIAGEVVISNFRDGGGMVGCNMPQVFRFADSLRSGVLDFGTSSKTYNVPMAVMEDLANRGLANTVTASTATDGRELFDSSPFIVEEIYENLPEYPAMWWTRSADEKTMVIQPNAQFRVKKDADGNPRKSHARRVWGYASRMKFLRDFGIGSNRIVMGLTEKASSGGRSWISLTPHHGNHESAMMLWQNSTLGMIMHWLHGIKAKLNRPEISVKLLPSLPFLDCRKLRDAQLKRSHELFEQFKNREFLPANEAYRDSVRKELDRAVLVELLGLDKSALDGMEQMRMRWCGEPTVHGFKATRPQ